MKTLHDVLVGLPENRRQQIEQRVAELVVSEEIARDELTFARIAVARDFIRERMVDGCYHCTGNGIVWDDTPDEQPCPACADARKILEVLK